MLNYIKNYLFNKKIITTVPDIIKIIILYLHPPQLINLFKTNDLRYDMSFKYNTTFQHNLSPRTFKFFFSRFPNINITKISCCISRPNDINIIFNISKTNHITHIALRTNKICVLSMSFLTKYPSLTHLELNGFHLTDYCAIHNMNLHHLNLQIGRAHV